MFNIDKNIHDKLSSSGGGSPSSINLIFPYAISLFYYDSHHVAFASKIIIKKESNCLFLFYSLACFRYIHNILLPNLFIDIGRLPHLSNSVFILIILSSTFLQQFCKFLCVGCCCRSC